MGSDMSMEHVVSEVYGDWFMDGDTQKFGIYNRNSYDNTIKMIWSCSGDEFEFHYALIKTFIKSLPARPKPKPTLKTRIVHALMEWSLCDGRGEPYEESELHKMAEHIIEEIEDHNE